MRFLLENSPRDSAVFKVHLEIFRFNNMANAWFLYTNDVVSGPFDTDEVRTKMPKGELASASYIWWKGQREWIPVSTWAAQLTSILQTADDRSSKPVWYIDAGKSPLGPLTEKELIDNLRAANSLAHVRLWAVGMEKWTNIFELGDVMELLGLSRRENERAPLMGTVAVTRSNDDPQGFVVRAASISVAGMGITGRHDLRAGDSISLLVKSGEIPAPLHLRGEISYVTSNGYAGVRFATVHAETQSMILDYVKQFNSDDFSKSQAA